jgi:hypothetical protein
MQILDLNHAGEKESGFAFAEAFERSTYSNFMKQSETQKYGTYLKKLSTEEIEKLLSCVLQEMRRRDSDRVTGDVLANSKALRKMRLSE